MINKKDVDFVIEAHENNSKTEHKKFRFFDRRTPYFVHPLWCACMISQETNLSEDVRSDGAVALLYHDVLEDTNVELPDWLDDRVKGLIEDLTFGSADEAMEEIWGKGEVVRLLKLYDKTNNFLDIDWMESERREVYLDCLRKLIDDVEKNFGELNITKLARILGKYKK